MLVIDSLSAEIMHEPKVMFSYCLRHSKEDATNRVYMKFVSYVHHDTNRHQRFSYSPSLRLVKADLRTP